MALICRADSVRSMASRANSTSALGRGFSHILKDAVKGKQIAELPDDIDALEDWLW